MSMQIEILGDSHLAESLRRAARLRGFQVDDASREKGVAWRPSLTFIAWDILDHADLNGYPVVEAEFNRARDAEGFGEAIIVVSQVPPGTTRALARGVEAVYYQADTIIMREALARAHAPEQFIIGCADPEAPLPLAYQEYLMAHGPCPVRQMSYESAEVAKLAINYALMKQIEAANDIAAVSEVVGADYCDVRDAMHGDARIGPRAYLRPGRTNRHLDRDIETVRAIIEQRTVAPGEE